MDSYFSSLHDVFIDNNPYVAYSLFILHLMAQYADRELANVTYTWLHILGFIVKATVEKRILQLSILLVLPVKMASGRN